MVLKGNYSHKRAQSSPKFNIEVSPSKYFIYVFWKEFTNHDHHMFSWIEINVSVTTAKTGFYVLNCHQRIIDYISVYTTKSEKILKNYTKSIDFP